MMNVYKMNIRTNFSITSLKRYGNYVDEYAIVAPNIIDAGDRATYILNELCLQAGKNAKFEILEILIDANVEPLTEDML